MATVMSSGPGQEFDAALFELAGLLGVEIVELARLHFGARPPGLSHLADRLEIIRATRRRRRG